MKTFTTIMLSFLCYACSFSHRLEEKRIDNVVRLFWHEGTQYSIHVQEPDSKEIKVIKLHPNMCFGGEYAIQPQPRLIADVPADKHMWVSYIIDYNYNKDCLKVLEIHVHSEKDVEGGGWNHGKFGSGQTVVVR